MTQIVPPEDKSNPVPRRMMLAIATACALFAAGSESFADDGPTFRSGLWKFERTLETNGEATDRLQTSGLPIARQMTRCVNPTLELKEELTPLKVGACNTRDLRKTDDGMAMFSRKSVEVLRRSRARSMSKVTALTRRSMRATSESYRRKKSW